MFGVVCTNTVFSMKMRIYRTGFGKLWKLIMQFSSNWKVLEKKFQNHYGKVLEFCLENSTMS